MVKQTGLILSVVGYALLTLAAPGLIICRHSDGRTMVELAASPCCAEKKTTPCCSEQTPSKEELSITASDDSCTDSPVQINNALLSQSSSHIDLALPSMCVDLTFLPIPHYETPAQVHTDFHDLPPSTVLTSLPTIIILC